MPYYLLVMRIMQLTFRILTGLSVGTCHHVSIQCVSFAAR